MVAVPIFKAMILSAGFGTRLRPLTLSVPKALIKVDGIPMIERVLNYLIQYGIKEVVINTHHLADKIKKFFSTKNFPIKVNLIYEKEILGTGGGIKNAKTYLSDVNCFLVHNVDVMSDINLFEMYNYHKLNNAFATLAIQKRRTSRPLIIDENMFVIGNKQSQEKVSLFGFCGIHIISSKIFDNFSENGFFDIFTTYFRLIQERNKKIIGYDIKNSYWQDFGKLENIS